MRVTIIGELNVDLIIKGQDLNLKWNSEKLIDSCDLVLGSSSAITALALAGLGVSVTFVSVIGNDLFGQYCLQELEKSGINTRYIIQRNDVKTGTTLSFSTDKDRALLTCMGSIPLLTLADISDECLEAADHVHFGSYFLQEGMRDHWEALFEKARIEGITTSFDMGWDVNDEWHAEQLVSLLKYTTLFIPSEDEVMKVFPSNSLDELVQQISSHGCLLGLKRGRKGSLLLDHDGKLTSTNAYDITPIDTTGAGDSFNAGLIYGYLNHWTSDKLLSFANACGAMATLRIGGASSVPNVDRVNNFMRTHEIPSPSKKES